MQVAGGDESFAAGIAAWLTSRDPQTLTAESSHEPGAVSFVLDGKTVNLKQGVHFSLP